MSTDDRPTVLTFLAGAPSARCDAIAAVLDAHLSRAQEPAQGWVLAKGYSRSDTGAVAALVVSADTTAAAREMLGSFPPLPRPS